MTGVNKGVSDKPIRLKIFSPNVLCAFACRTPLLTQQHKQTHSRASHKEQQPHLYGLRHVYLIIGEE